MTNKTFEDKNNTGLALLSDLLMRFDETKRVTSARRVLNLHTIYEPVQYVT